LHRRSTAALVVACLALLLAAGGGAYATVSTTGNPVNIVDPVSAKAAQVSNTGALKVTGTVTTNTSPGNFVSAAVLALASNSGCVTLLAPPAGRALVLTQVTVNTYINPTPGVSNLLRVVDGPGCSGPTLATVNPGSVGATVVPFGSGVGIPEGSAVSAFVAGNIQAEAYAYGYTVSSGSVVAKSTATQSSAGGDQQSRG
jgi:hypothetical protein